MSALDYPDVQPILSGCDELRDGLIGCGFKCWEDAMRSSGNHCNWYACRRISAPSRECECNDGKLQLVIKPFAFSVCGTTHASVEAAIVGECDGTWFDVKAYALSAVEVMDKLDNIEAMLVSAWNALKPMPGTESVK